MKKNKTCPRIYNFLKVLSYWNLNYGGSIKNYLMGMLKVLSYWNLNSFGGNGGGVELPFLKYYHIGI